jgi:hypothetical protein
VLAERAAAVREDILAEAFDLVATAAVADWLART